MSSSQHPMYVSDYDKLWAAIKAAEYKHSIRVEVEQQSRERLIQAISKLKARENKGRAALGLPTFGVMQVERLPPEPGSTVRVVLFSLPRSLEHFL